MIYILNMMELSKNQIKSRYDKIFQKYTKVFIEECLGRRNP